MPSASLKLLLISTAVFLIALLLKDTTPLLLHFSVYQAPLIWSSILSWLKPPYLYIIINAIIITIAASSRFHCHTSIKYDNHDHDHREAHVHVQKISADLPSQCQMPDHPRFHSYDFDLDDEMKVSTAEIEVKASRNAEIFEDKNVLAVVNDDNVDDEFLVSSSTSIPLKMVDSLDNSPEIMNLAPSEKPLVSRRFGHRKPVKASLEGGRTLRVSKPRRHETLENTWKMITEGRAMPLTRHLKKSDSWENQGREMNFSGVDTSQVVKISERCDDRTNYQLPPMNGSSDSPGAAAASTGKLRKEPSLSQDDLNRRVEAFIKKFNEEMRLQREESLNQYKEMISRCSP